MKWRPIHILIIILLFYIIKNQTETNYYTKEWNSNLNLIDGIPNIISTYNIGSKVIYLSKNEKGNNIMSVNINGNKLSQEVDFEGVSSVFQYNNDNIFFVCPKRGKRVYKIEIGMSIKLSQLSNPEEIVLEKDFYIKCFQIDKVFNIGYINYDGKAYIIPFIYSNNNLSQGKEYIDNSGDGKIKAVINRQFSEKMVFILLLKSNSQVIIQVMQYNANPEINQPNGSQINKDSYDDNSIILYSINQMSLYNNQLLIISYEPNSLSSSYSCNVLSYSPSNNKSEITFTYNYFPVLLMYDFSIIEAQFFNDETQFYYYLIQSTKGLYYIGVVDARYNIVIYNSQQNYENVFVYNLIDNHSYYLGISKPDESNYLCAFFTENNNCINSCDQNYNINSQGNSCSSNTSSYMVSSYSFSEICPLGYYKEKDSDSICSYCTKKFDSGKCEEKCSSENRIDGTICKSCSDLHQLSFKGNELVIENKLYKQGSCIDKEICPEFAEKNYSTNLCIICKDSNQYLSNGICVENCPEGNEIQENNACFDCQTNNKYYDYFGEKCIDECPTNAEKDDSKNICKICKDNKDPQFLSIDKKCVDSCGDGMIYDPETYICLDCDQGTFSYNNKCNKQCPINTKQDPENKKCINCKELKEYYFDNECYQTCPDYTEANDDEYICINCKEKGLILLDGVCVEESKCPENAVITDKGKCEPCQHYFYDNKCLDSCPLNGYALENKICRVCKNENKYLYNNDCHEKCPNGSEVNKDSNVCIHCSDEGKFYENDKCMKECSPGSSYDKDNICDYCKGHDPPQFLSNNTCITDCPRGTEADENNICQSCTSEKPFYYKEKCYEKCPDLTRPNSIEMICEDSCLIECFNDGECDAINNKCICKDGYSGKYCEISSSDSKSSEIEIFPFNEAITLKTINIIKYSTTLIFDEGYSLLWKVYNRDTNEEILNENYLNGKKEEILKLSSEAFNEFNRAVIQLTITDKGTGKSHIGAIEVSFNEFENSFDVQIQYKGRDPDSAIAMKDIVLISVTSKLRRLSETPNLLTYCFSFIDMKEEVIPFTYDETKTRDNFYEGVVPYTKMIVITITNSRGQSIDIKKDINIVKDDNYSELIPNIQNNSYPLYQKLLEVYNYIVHHIDENLSEDDISIIKDLIINEENKLSLAILNYLMSHTNQNNIEELNNLFFDLVDDLKGKINDDITNENMKPFYRNLDGILNSTLNSEDGENKTEKIEKIKESIKTLNNYLSQNLSPGETIKVDTSTFQSIIHKPGRDQSSLIINDDEDTQNKNFEDFSDYSIKSAQQTEEANSKECKDSNLFCVKGSSYKQLENNLINLLNTNITNVTFNVIKMNSTQLYKDRGYTPMTTSSIITAMYANNSNDELKTINMDYTVSFKVSPEFDITTQNVNSTCVPISLVTAQSLTCKTYFNYKTNRTICKCNKTGEIAGLFDYALANFNKLLQFPKISINMINPLSASFVACSLSLIIVFSTILLIYDYLDDKEEIIYIKLTEAEKVKKELIQIKGLKGSKILGLTWFVTANVFPFFEMIYIYNYNQPRYIRFIIQMISMLVSLLFSILPYYKTEFTYKQIFIDERDIEKEDWDISNLPTQIWDVICSLIYSIAASISIIIIVSIFSCLLGFKEILLETWKYRKKIILNYIRQNLVTDELTKWNRVKTKIRVVNTFFDVLNRIKEIKKTQGSFSVKEYNANYGPPPKIYERKSFDNFPELIQNKKLIASMNTDKKSFYIEKNGGFNLNGVKEEAKEKLITEDKLKEKIKQIKKKYSKTEDLIKMGVHFGRYGNIYYESINKHLGYQELEIERNSNYSFFNFSENIVEKKENCTEKVNILKTVIASLIMMIIIALIYLYLIVMFADIYERYQFYIVKVWLVPSLISLTLVRLATSFAQNLVYILVVIYFYKTRYKTKLTKFLFKFIIPKYLIYTYKVQMLLNKYDKQLKKDLALKTGKNDAFL